MGPRSIDREGNPGVTRIFTAYRVRFNGAAVDRSRKSLEMWRERAVKRASMGPRSIDRGSLHDREKKPAPAAASFNGAAINRSRKCHRLAAHRLAKPRFNGAAINRSRK